MNKRKVDMNTMFHVVVTLKNGMHKTLRVARYVVAKIVTEFRNHKSDIFKRVAIVRVNDDILVLNDVKEMRITYENTHAEFLTLA